MLRDDPGNLTAIYSVCRRLQVYGRQDQNLSHYFTKNGHAALCKAGALYIFQISVWIDFFLC